jgi:hypothetical protein
MSEQGERVRVPRAAAAIAATRLIAWLVSWIRHRAAAIKVAH